MENVLCETYGRNRIWEYLRKIISKAYRLMGLQCLELIPQNNFNDNGSIKKSNSRCSRS